MYVVIISGKALFMVILHDIDFEILSQMFVSLSLKRVICHLKKKKNSTVKTVLKYETLI